MANLRTKQQLLDTIEANIADNNAGSISAADIRNPMSDLTYSINSIVGSGDHNTGFPFVNNVRAKKTGGANGFFIAEGGVNFPNGGGDQTLAYPGPSGIDHNDLLNRNNIDSHPGFLDLGGTRSMTGNLKMNGNYVSASGSLTPTRGLKFEYLPSGDKITVGENTSLNFQDGSQMKSGRGLAKAWINFDASSGVVVNSYHNVHSIERVATGKFKLTIPSGVLKNQHCVVFGHSNSRDAAGTAEDFDRNYIGLVDRTFTGSGTVVINFQVLNEASQYVNAEINDMVVFGYDVDEPAQSDIIIID